MTSDKKGLSAESGTRTTQGDLKRQDASTSRFVSHSDDLVFEVEEEPVEDARTPKRRAKPVHK